MIELIALLAPGLAKTALVIGVVGKTIVTGSLAALLLAGGSVQGNKVLKDYQKPGPEVEAAFTQWALENKELS